MVEISLIIMRLGCMGSDSLVRSVEDASGQIKLGGRSVPKKESAPIWIDVVAISFCALSTNAP